MQSCIYVVSFFKVTCDSPCKNKHQITYLILCLSCFYRWECTRLDTCILTCSCRRIHHPNMLQLLGVLKDASSVTIITTLIDGPNLHDLIFDETHKRVSQ